MHATAARPAARWRRALVASFGIVVLWGSLAAGQQGGSGSSKSKAKPAEKAAARSLEDLLAAALKNNPDVRVTEAKVRETEAELNRVRLQVTQKVVTLYQALAAQKALVESVQSETDRLTQLHKTGVAPAGGLEAARQKVLQAQAKLSEIEAEIAYLTGQQPAGLAADARDLEALRLVYAQQLALAQRTQLLAAGPSETSPPQVTMAEKLRKALDTPVKVDFDKKTPDEILKELQPKLGGVPVRDPSPGLKAMQTRLSVHLPEPVPLGAVFQLLEDETKDLYFLVREYGIIVVPRSLENTHPPGAEGLIDFWKGSARRRFGSGSGGSGFPGR